MDARLWTGCPESYKFYCEVTSFLVEFHTGSLFVRPLKETLKLNSSCPVLVLLVLPGLKCLIFQYLKVLQSVVKPRSHPSSSALCWSGCSNSADYFWSFSAASGIMKVFPSCWRASQESTGVFYWLLPNDGEESRSQDAQIRPESWVKLSSPTSSYTPELRSQPQILKTRPGRTTSLWQGGAFQNQIQI